MTQSPEDLPTTLVAEVPISRTTLEGAVKSFIAGATGLGPGQAVRLVNSYSVALAQKQREYGSVLRGPGVNFPDGKPVAALVRILDVKHPYTVEQVRGPSFFERVLEAGRAYGLRHYLLGGTEDTLTRLRRAIDDRLPGTQIVGAMAPPFRELTAAEVAEIDKRIAAASPDVVWVGLGTPKQDYEALRVARRHGVWAVGVGAAFDFLAGTKPVAPPLFRAMSLEWLFRLATEPRRLWRRYLFGNARFLSIAVKSVVTETSRRTCDG